MPEHQFNGCLKDYIVQLRDGAERKFEIDSSPRPEFVGVSDIDVIRIFGGLSCELGADSKNKELQYRTARAQEELESRMSGYGWDKYPEGMGR